MSCEERRSPYNLESLLELEVLLCDELTQTLQSDECSMSLVAVVNLWCKAELAECTDTADAEKELLLETVLPVSTIKVVSD